MLFTEFNMEDFGEVRWSEGRAKGKAEGILEGLIKTARNLLNLDMPIDTIVKATGLSEKEIKSLAIV